MLSSGKTAPLIATRVIGKQNLFRAFAIGTTTNNNYSTTTTSSNKLNFLTRFHTNKTNVFTLDVKHYSSSSNKETTIRNSMDLDPVEYESWSKEQVCSLLCETKKNGGAALSFEDVKPLYDAGFDGNSLATIASYIQDKDNIYFAAEQLTRQFTKAGIVLTVRLDKLQTVVFWVDNLLKTRLYHLWSADKLGETLCKVFTEAGAEVPTGLLNSKKLSSQEMIELVADCKEFVQWKQGMLISPRKISANEFISNGGWQIPVYSAIPFQNNQDMVLKVGETLLNNIYIKESKEDSRHLKLLNNFSYYGIGKTRFGIEFLDLWKKHLTENPNEIQKLIKQYGQNAFDRVYNAELIYIDLTSHKFKLNDSTLSYLRNVVPTNDITYFVVLDDYPHFCSRNKKSPILQTMYDIWISTIFHIQKLPNVAGVYVCGKGPSLDVFGTSCSEFRRSPSQCQRIDLRSLTIMDLRSIFTQYPKVKQSLIENGIYESTLQEIMNETAGIPLLVDRLIDLIFRIIPVTMNDVLLLCNKLEEQVQPYILYPFERAYESHAYQVYSFLMFISLMMPQIDAKKQFDAKLFGLEKIEELEFLTSVDICELTESLNCYVDSNNDKVRLVFPRKTVQKLASFTPHISIAPFVDLIPHLLDKGASFESLIGSFVIWRSKCGFVCNLTFSAVFPFLTGTRLENSLCVDLKYNPIATNVAETKNVKDFWQEVYSNFHLYQNKLNCLLESSEKFIIVKQDMWWLIQHKSTFSFTELANEIKNLSRFPKKVKIIFTIMYKCQVGMEMIHRGPNSIHRPIVKGSGIPSEILEIKIPKNVTVVIVDATQVKKVIGKKNFEALIELEN